MFALKVSRQEFQCLKSVGTLRTLNPAVRIHSYVRIHDDPIGSLFDSLLLATLQRDLSLKVIAPKNAMLETAVLPKFGCRRKVNLSV